MKNIELYEKAADETGHLYFEKYLLNSEDATAGFAHFHDSVEFIFVREGEYFAHVGTAQKNLQAGEAAFVDSFTPHFYRALGKATVYAAVIDKRLFSSDKISTLVFDAFPVLPKEGFDAIMRFFDAVEPYVGASDEIKSGFSDMLAGLLYRFCPAHEKKEDKATRTFAEVLKYLNAHFCENVTLADLAARFYYSENHFSALFNSFTGMSLREYVNRRRIAEILRRKAQDSGKSLFSLALDCGYVNEKTFYRAYAKYKNP